LNWQDDETEEENTGPSERPSKGNRPVSKSSCTEPHGESQKTEIRRQNLWSACPKSSSGISLQKEIVTIECHGERSEAISSIKGLL
jgi:hypothetical protein